MSVRRSNTICGLFERPDHYYGDDLGDDLVTRAPQGRATWRPELGIVVLEKKTVAD